MGRELRRKEERKNKNIKKKEELDTSVKGSTILKILGVVLLILLVLYYVVAVFVTKEIDVSGNKGADTNDSTSASSVSNKILASAIFNQKEETYYVYFYDFEDEDSGISSAISSRSDIKIYKVDTSSSLNSKYVTEESGNASATTLEELKVKNPTLLEITNDQITGYYEGSSLIIDFLSR